MTVDRLNNDPIDELIPEGGGRWCVVANIVRHERGSTGGEKYLGTPIYAPGAKIYVLSFISGDREKMAVLGKSRKSNKKKLSILALNALEDFRPKFLYSPDIIKRILSAEWWRDENKYFDGENWAVGKYCMVKSKYDCELLAKYYSELSVGKYDFDFESKLRKDWFS